MKRTALTVIAGESDPILRPDYVKRSVVDSIPMARLVTLPCGHEVPIEMPRETAWLVESFAAGIQAHAAEARSA